MPAPDHSVFGRPFEKWFALSHQTIVCPVCDVGVLWLNSWMDQDATWHGHRPQPRPQCYMGTQLPPKRGTDPHFSAHVYCGQTAGWIKMPLGREVILGPGDFVLDGDPAAPLQEKGAQQPPTFRLMCIVAIVRWGPSSFHGKGHSSPPPLLVDVCCGQSEVK